jgi:hypothetical protein
MLFRGIKLWYSRDKSVLLDAAGSDLREFALLWLVFSFLDKIVQNESLSLSWIMTHGSFSTFLWCVGIYCNVTQKSEQGNE